MITFAETAEPFAFDIQMFSSVDIGDAGGTGNLGTGSGGSSGGTNADEGRDGKTQTEEKIYTESHVKKIHEENAQRRHQIKELEAKLKQREDADAAAAVKKLEEDGEFKKAAETERKRADKAVADAEAKVKATQRRAIRETAKARLISEGILDADDVDLLDLSKAEWDNDADEPKNIDDIVAAFKAAKPAKFKTEGDGTGGERRAKTIIPSNKNANDGGKGDDAKNWSKEKRDAEWKTIRL